MSLRFAARTACGAKENYFKVLLRHDFAAFASLRSSLANAQVVA